jgi:hypothetical protein
MRHGHLCQYRGYRRWGLMDQRCASQIGTRNVPRIDRTAPKTNSSSSQHCSGHRSQVRAPAVSRGLDGVGNEVPGGMLEVTSRLCISELAP